MDKELFNKIIVRNFTTETETETDIEYSAEIKEKFVEICRAELMSRVINKKDKRDNVLLRSEIIIKEFVGKVYSVYNGLIYVRLLVKKNMLGFKVGEFILTKKNKKYRMKSLSPVKLTEAEKKKRMERRRRKEDLLLRAQSMTDMKNTI
jgi:ribosomal protein S19